jgi:hypothetical protein
MLDLAATSLWDEGRKSFIDELKKQKVAQDVIDEFLSDKAFPEDAKQSCLLLQKDAERKFGDAKILGGTIPKKWISSIMDNIDKFVSIADYGTKGAPETVGLAWFAVKQVLNAVKQNYDLYKIFGSALTSITEMLVIIRTYDKLYDERKTPTWKASDVADALFDQIRKVYSAILDFSFSVKKHLTADTWGKIETKTTLNPLGMF